MVKRAGVKRSVPTLHHGHVSLCGRAAIYAQWREAAFRITAAIDARMLMGCPFTFEELGGQVW